jgi:hypothetical protein
MGQTTAVKMLLAETLMALVAVLNEVLIVPVTRRGRLMEGPLGNAAISCILIKLFERN